MSLSPPFAIQKKSIFQPPRIILFGVEGIGKTHFATQFPNPFFLMTPRETGLITLQASGQVGEIDHFPAFIDFPGLMSAIQWIVGGEHEIKTLVVDTINGVERDLYMPFVIKTQFGGDNEKFTAFARDKKYPHDLWKAFLDALDAVRSRGIAILLLGHAALSRLNNPDGKDYDRYVPRFLNQATWDMTFAWADVVMFANHVTATVQDGLKFKGRMTGIRKLYTEKSAAYDAKNRYRLPVEIDMGETANQAYANFMAAFASAKERNGNINGIVTNGSSKQPQQTEYQTQS